MKKLQSYQILKKNADFKRQNEIEKFKKKKKKISKYLNQENGFNFSDYIYLFNKLIRMCNSNCVFFYNLKKSVK